MVCGAFPPCSLRWDGCAFRSVFVIQNITILEGVYKNSIKVCIIFTKNTLNLEFSSSKILWLLPPVWFLSSWAKGPRGGCLARLRSTRMQRDLSPFTMLATILTWSSSGSAHVFLLGVCNEKSCNEIVTIVTCPKVDQLFCPFAVDSAILSSTFGIVTCHDRDMSKSWPTFLPICSRDLHFELGFWGPEMSQSWHVQKLSKLLAHLQQGSPFWARSLGDFDVLTTRSAVSF